MIEYGYEYEKLAKIMKNGIYNNFKTKDETVLNYLADLTAINEFLNITSINKLDKILDTMERINESELLKSLNSMAKSMHILEFRNNLLTFIFFKIHDFILQSTRENTEKSRKEKFDTKHKAKKKLKELKYNQKLEAISSFFLSTIFLYIQAY